MRGTTGSALNSQYHYNTISGSDTETEQHQQRHQPGRGPPVLLPLTRLTLTHECDELEALWKLPLEGGRNRITVFIIIFGLPTTCQGVAWTLQHSEYHANRAHSATHIVGDCEESFKLSDKLSLSSERQTRGR